MCNCLLDFALALAFVFAFNFCFYCKDTFGYPTKLCLWSISCNSKLYLHVQQLQPSDPIDDSHQYDDGDDTDQEVENDDGRLEDDAQGTFIFMLEVSSYFLILSSLRALCTFHPL